MDKLHVNSPLLQPRVFAKRHSQAAKSNQSLKCSVCTKKFLKSSIYEKHKLFHRSSNLLECPNCFKSLDSLKKVLKHKSIHLKKEKKFECFCCKQEFSKYFSLLSHFQSKICSWNRKAKQKPILFQTQGKNTKSKESWPNIAPQRILENINKEFLKSCTSEPYSLNVFNSNSQFRSHLEESGHINEDSKNSEVSIKDSDSDLEIGNEAASKIINIISPKMKYECPLCQTSLGCNSDAFTTHIKLHQTETIIVCQYCFQEFSDIYALDTHVVEQHEDKLYNCPYGDFVTENHSSLLLHFECKGHKSVNNECLKNIAVTKLENKSYGQDKCLKLGKIFNELEVHHNETDEEFRKIINQNIFSASYKSREPKKCDICFMELGGERSLKSHQKTHLTGFPLECSQCLMGFEDENKLRKHRKQHQDFFECLSCSEEFETYIRFLKHLEDTHHNEAYKDSYQVHSKHIPKIIQVMFNNETENNIIQDLTDRDKIEDPAFPLLENFVEEEDLKFKCSKSVSFLIDDELHSLSDTDSISLSKENKRCDVQSNDPLRLKQMQLDFESSDSDEAIETVSIANIERFCNSETDEYGKVTNTDCVNNTLIPEILTITKEVKVNRTSVLNSKINSILTSAVDILNLNSSEATEKSSTNIGPDNQKNFHEKNEVSLLDTIRMEQNKDTEETFGDIMAKNRFQNQNEVSAESIKRVRLEEQEKEPSQDPDSSKVDDELRNDCYTYNKTPCQHLYKEVKEESIVKNDSDDKSKCKVDSVKKGCKTNLNLQIVNSTQDGDGKVYQEIKRSRDIKIINENDEKVPYVKNKRIPIYKKAYLGSSHQEYFSDKFVNRNTLLKKNGAPSKKLNQNINNLERKFVERRKFGSLNTKFQGRKKVSSNMLFGKDDPFSIETEDHAVFLGKEEAGKLDQSTLANVIVNEEPAIKNQGSILPCHSLNVKKPEDGGETISNYQRLTLKKNLEITKNKKKKQSYTKYKRSNSNPKNLINPSCPYCFKILLNQERMKHHIIECKKNQEIKQTSNLKFKIKIKPDSKNILEQMK